jgi:hypothetical protein
MLKLCECYNPLKFSLNKKIVVHLTSSCVNWAFFGTRGPNKHKNELNTTFFLFNDPLKDSKSLKIFKISLTFHFDKL